MPSKVSEVKACGLGRAPNAQAFACVLPSLSSPRPAPTHAHAHTRSHSAHTDGGSTHAHLDRQAHCRLHRGPAKAHHTQAGLPAGALCWGQGLQPEGQRPARAGCQGPAGSELHLRRQQEQKGQGSGGRGGKGEGEAMRGTGRKARPVQHAGAGADRHSNQLSLNKAHACGLLQLQSTQDQLQLPSIASPPLPGSPQPSCSVPGSAA